MSYPHCYDERMQNQNNDTCKDATSVGEVSSNQSGGGAGEGVISNQFGGSNQSGKGAGPILKQEGVRKSDVKSEETSGRENGHLTPYPLPGAERASRLNEA